MQLTQYKPRYIEKILVTDDGKFLGRFLVISEGKSFKLKLVEMIPFENRKPLANSTLLLSSPKINQIISKILRISTEVISPFSNLNFFISQPTRAPSL